MVQKATHPRFSPRTQRSGTNRAAFTLIELLVVAAIIILLLALLVVGLNAATRTAQKTRTAALMNSMKQGLITFKAQIGYYPPVLGVPYTTAGPGSGAPSSADLRRLFPNSVPNPDIAYGSGSYVNHMQDYYSTCTLADYLIGYGPHTEDGYGRVSGAASTVDWDAETGAGIRHPGSDGAWGSTFNGSSPFGELNDRMKMGTSFGSESSPLPVDQGKVYNPFLELKDDRLIAGVYYGPTLQTFFQGDALPAGVTWDSLPKAIVDYWGQPIRYYRRPYPTGGLTQSYRAADRTGDGISDRVPTLSDVFVLRPFNVKPGTESDGLADGAGDTTTTRDLDAAEFALLSSGPDKTLNSNVRADKPDDFNKDNIVEVGP